ncbi:hypothetical protein, partial [Victivallis sp.]|uniref:hypothetical protein n=1 Tax=Victivallis sp. TaxID=2049020 RepID=UPI003A92054E
MLAELSVRSWTSIRAEPRQFQIIEMEYSTVSISTGFRKFQNIFSFLNRECNSDDQRGTASGEKLLNIIRYRLKYHTISRCGNTHSGFHPGLTIDIHVLIRRNPVTLIT